MGLRAYRAKRRFATTPEPEPLPGHRGRDPVFVVQKHAARALHYDLRLELDGVLKSWAVPRGPSLNPAVKRLAVRVEDHPLDYQGFEGVIPKGHYGAGGVIVWDRGRYRHPLARDGKENARLLREGLRKGELKILLEGEKLQGEFALVKTGQDEKSWLLIKKRDGYATTAEILAQDRSVLSGRTLAELSRSDPAPPREAHPAGPREALAALAEAGPLTAPVAAMPRAIKPMLATLVREPFDHPDWVFEIKWDGYRAIAEVRAEDLSLYSRNGVPLEKRYPAIAESLEKIGFEALLDGEIVVVDDRGEPDFQLLQEYPKTGRGHLLYCVFDLLHLAGRDLTNLPLLQRKGLLRRLLPPLPNVRFSDHVAAEGTLFFQAVKARGIEGIVAKHAQSPYRMGRRSRQWLKVKTHLTQEAVIAGFTEPRGSRRPFGALVLGVYAGGELIYVGHAGGGFGAGMLGEIRARLEPLIRKRCPFRAEPQTNGPVTWVKPQLVCEVRFQGWTDEGLLRQPVFLRLRADKAAREVRREVFAAKTAAGEAPL